MLHCIQFDNVFFAIIQNAVLICGAGWSVWADFVGWGLRVMEWRPISKFPRPVVL